MPREPKDLFAYFAVKIMSSPIIAINQVYILSKLCSNFKLHYILQIKQRYIHIYRIKGEIKMEME